MPSEHLRHAVVEDVSGAPGRLGLLVEQLWAPVLESGAARLVLGPVAPDAGWVTAEEYLAVPTVARATMLLPRTPPAALRGSLLNYRGLRRTGPNAQRTALGAVASLRLPLPFPTVTVQARPDRVAELPLTVIGAGLGPAVDEGEGLRAAIGVRTGANRKATLQLVRLDGRPAGFAKLAWNSSSQKGIERETAALADAPPTGPARRPGLLATGSYAGRPFLVSSPLPPDVRGVRSDVPAPTPLELAELTPVVRTAPAGTTRQLQDLRSRVLALTPSPETGAVVAAMLRLLEGLAASSREHRVVRRWHGDLTPWNTARDGAGVLWCWDWESSEEDALAGLDVLHWLLTVETERGAPLSGDALRTAFGRARPHLVALGTEPASWPEVAAGYAVTLAERACDLAETGGWAAGWVLPHQLEDMLSAAAGLLAEAR